MENKRILAINPGSTSTKMAVFESATSIYLKTIKHTFDDLKPFEKITDQLGFRKNLILKELAKENIDLDQIKIVIGRGGLINPIESGVYEVNEAMIRDLYLGVMGEHASNLGGLIADEIARSLPDARALIADPVVVDELQDVARVTGHPLFVRKSIFHALNQKAIARLYGQSIGQNYEDMNLIIAHLGGGISVGAHCRGKVIDVNQALDGEGPMSPERSGTLPIGDLLKVCFSGDYDFKTLKKMVTGEGGFVAYFGTNDAYKVEMMAKNGDIKARQIQDALAYHVSKSIGSCAVVLKGKVDAILLTGGLAHNKTLTEYISDHVSFIAKVFIYPGEDEMKSLAINAIMVMNNEIECKVYQ
jgi:butyrate kinase